MTPETRRNLETLVDATRGRGRHVTIPVELLAELLNGSEPQPKPPTRRKSKPKPKATAQPSTDDTAAEPADGDT